MAKLDKNLNTFAVIDFIPHKVAELVVKKNYNLLRAWRIHLKMTQTEVSKKAQITQSALSQMEKTENSHRTKTLLKIAQAMNLSIKQLKD